MRIRRSKAGTVTSFANTKRQFQARREVSPAPIHNIYTFYESETSELDTENVDIETRTLEQYLALDLNNTRRRFTCPDNSMFEVKGQHLRELCKISFSGNPTDSVVEHISNVLEIASIFNTQEPTLVKVFPLTLEGIAKRNHSMSKALADLEESISVMPYSLFKILGLGSLKPIKMTIEMADRSMQSPKGIKENVLVKISNFMFPVDFVVLDIMEDVSIGRPILATIHAKINVYGKKISLGIGNDQVGDFENYLSPEYGNQDIILLSPSELAEDKEDFSITHCDPDKRMGTGLEEFVDIGDTWDDLDLGILSDEKAKIEFFKSG
ncbi:homeodomain-like protein, partial [Tanacetum coccineum]